jgi:hypothetical protein
MTLLLGRASAMVMWQVRFLIRATRPARACAPALQRRAGADGRHGDVELVAVQAVVGLGVRHRGGEHLLDVARGIARHEGEDGAASGTGRPRICSATSCALRGAVRT